MKRKKEDYIVFVFAVILVFIVFTLVIISLQPKPKQIIEATTTVTTTTIPTIEPTIPAANGEPPVTYNSSAQDKLLDYIKNRRPLSEDDKVAKASILAALPDG